MVELAKDAGRPAPQTRSPSDAARVFAAAGGFSRITRTDSAKSDKMMAWAVAAQQGDEAESRFIPYRTVAGPGVPRYP